MKVLKYMSGASKENSWHMAAFSFWFVSYGRIVTKKTVSYQIELVAFKVPVKIYRSSRKPIIRDLYLISALLSPIYFIMAALCCVAFALIWFLEYPIETLVEKTFITNARTVICGWTWIVLAIYGIVRIFI